MPAEPNPVFPDPPVDRTPYRACWWLGALTLSVAAVGLVILWTVAGSIRRQHWFALPSKPEIGTRTLRNRAGSVDDQLQQVIDASGDSLKQQAGDAASSAIERGTDAAVDAAKDAAVDAASDAAADVLPNSIPDALKN